MLLQDDKRGASVVVGFLAPFLPPLSHLSCRMVCRTWNRWFPLPRTLNERQRDCKRMLTDPEIDSIVQRMRAMNYPWTEATEEYVRQSLTAFGPLLPLDASEALEDLTQLLERLFGRSFLDPKSNIGTLDTTRVIERLTQARLSRFHTASASVCVFFFFLFGNGCRPARVLPVCSRHPIWNPGECGLRRVHTPQTANLLHPQQSARNPQMLVYLDPEKLDVQSCGAVMSHLRGRLLATRVSSFLAEPPHPLVNHPLHQLPPLVRSRLEAADADESAQSVNGIRMVLDTDALVWHNLTVPALVRRLAPVHPDLHLLPALGQGEQQWELYAISRRLRRLRSDGNWEQTLPSVQTLLEQTWPCVADIFCADSSSTQDGWRLGHHPPPILAASTPSSVSPSCPTGTQRSCVSGPCVSWMPTSPPAWPGM